MLGQSRRKRDITETNVTGNIENSPKKVAFTSKAAPKQTPTSKGAKRTSDAMYDTPIPVSSPKRNAAIETVLEPELEALISDSIYKEELREGVKALRLAKIPYHGNENVYKALKRGGFRVANLAKIFHDLQQFEISCQENPTLCSQIIDKLYYVEILISGLPRLSHLKLPLQNTKFFSAIVDLTYHFDTVVEIFTALKELNVPFSEDVELCLAIIKHSYSGNLIKAFQAFAEAKIAYQDPALCKVIVENTYEYEKILLTFTTFMNNVPYHEALYTALIENIKHADKLVKGFERMAKAGFAFAEHSSFYQSLIKNPLHAEELGSAFAVLAEGGVSFKTNTMLYKAVMNNPSQAEKLASGFVTLIKGGILFKANRALYRAFIIDPFYADKLCSGFVTLAQAGFSYQKNKELYDLLLNHKGYSDVLAKGFVVFFQAGIPYSGNAQLYNKLAEREYFAHRFTKKTLEMLVKANIVYQKNLEFYIEVISKINHAEEIERYFQLLIDTNVLYPGNEELYQAVLDIMGQPSKFIEIFSLYQQLGIHFPKYTQFYREQFLFNNDDIVFHFLSKLQAAGYSFKTHEKAFTDLFTLAQDKSNNQIIINIVDNLCTYAKTHTLLQDLAKGIPQQFAEIDVIVQQHSREVPLTFGPLNKSEVTQKLEELLKEICRGKTAENTQIYFKEPDAYLLKLPHQAEVNLSLLLRNANLTQLTLSDKLINSLAQILSNNLNEYVKEKVEARMDRQNKVVKLLPAGLRMAIELYIGTPCSYIDINRLFRGEALSNEPQLNFDHNKNIFACFIAGCLLNEAANKLNVLPWQHPEVISLGIHNELIDRIELLNDEAIQRRLANASKFPALTSFSRFKSGVNGYFRSDANTKTKLQIGHAFVVNDYMGEVILPQGEQVLTRRGPGYFVSTIVRSPTLDPKNHFWSEVALFEARQEHLLKEYADTKSAIKIDDQVVVRPNHGSPHTYRVMLLIELVIQYFAQHAKDPKFKAFCENLGDAEMEWLRVAAAFSVTGRESEIAATANPNKYDSYRAASATHFMNFVEKNAKDEKTMMKRMHHIVRYMGNPCYEASGKSAAINNHPNPQEREIRNFTHRILTIAHNIDLVRCYKSADYENSMKLCWDLSEPSEGQRSALNEIIRYDIALNKAHGNYLKCDIDAVGNLRDVQLDYRENFVRANRSLKELFELTETVSRPRLDQKKSHTL